MVCIKCGNRNNDDAFYCILCGTKIDRDAINGMPEVADQQEYGFYKPDSAYIRPQINSKQSEYGEYDNNNLILYLDNYDMKLNNKKLIEPITSGSVAYQLPQNNTEAWYQSIDNDMGNQELMISEEMEPMISMEVTDFLENFPKRSDSLYKSKSKAFGNFRTKLIFILGISIIFVSALIMFFVTDQDKPYFPTISENAINIIALSDGTQVFDSKGRLLHRLEEVVSSFKYSKDYTAGIIKDYNRKKCYYINTKYMDYLGDYYEAIISDYGDTVLFVINQNDAYRLKLYDSKTREITEIDKTKSKPFNNLHLSPDGKTVIYSIASFANPALNRSYISINGNKSKSLGMGKNVLAVSNHGKYIYYNQLREGKPSELYVQSKDNTTKLLVDFADSIFFNHNLTEIIYTQDDRTYLSHRGGEGKEIANEAAKVLITPSYGITRYMNGDIYGIDSFRNKFMVFGDGTIKHIDNKWQTRDIAFDAKLLSAVISEDGKRLLYETNDNRIIRLLITGRKVIEERFTEIKGRCYTSRDLSKAYIVTPDSKLYYINEDKESALIAEDIGQLVMHPSGEMVFFMENYIKDTGSLYYSKDGEAAKVVAGANGGVNELYPWNYGVVYQVNTVNGYDIYYNTEEAKFKRIISVPTSR